MGRPKGSKNRPGPRVHKVPVVGGKALRGRPRKDGLPPIQRKALLTPEQAAEEAVKVASAAFLERIRLFSPKLVPKLLAVQIRWDFPGCGVVAEDFEPNGRYYEIAQQGKCRTVSEMADAMIERGRQGGKGTIDAMFVLKCQGDWAETPAAREKAKKADEEDVIVGVDVRVTE